MVPLVGGAAHAPALVPLLEALAKEEETVVRDAAVASLCKVGATFSRAQAMEHLVPCIRVRPSHPLVVLLLHRGFRLSLAAPSAALW